MHLNLIQVAESFGVSEKIVEDWMRREGMPHTADRGRVLFDREQVAGWAAARGLAAQAGFLAPSAGAGTGLRLAPLLRAGGIWRDVGAAESTEVFARVVAALPGATQPVRQLLAQRMRAAGGVTYAPVGGGFALPHPRTRIAPGRDSGTVALLFLKEPITLAEPVPDAVAVTRLIFFIAPSPGLHLDLLARLTRSLVRGPFRELMIQEAPDREIHRALEAEDCAAPAGPGAETGRPA